MSQVVEALKPLLNLKDMASSSYFYHTMQAERMAHSSSMNSRSSHSLKVHGSFVRANGQQPMRSMSDGPPRFPVPLLAEAEHEIARSRTFGSP
jgi:hypothetical protein